MLVTVFLGGEGLTFIALAIVAHRLDLWIEWQTTLAGAALGVGVAAVVVTIVRERSHIQRPTTTRWHRYVEEPPPPVDAGELRQRIGARPGLAPAAQRSDGPIEGTNRP
jgi:hypothetical protein